LSCFRCSGGGDGGRGRWWGRRRSTIGSRSSTSGESKEHGVGRELWRRRLLGKTFRVHTNEGGIAKKSPRLVAHLALPLRAMLLLMMIIGERLHFHPLVGHAHTPPSPAEAFVVNAAFSSLIAPFTWHDEAARQRRAPLADKEARDVRSSLLVMMLGVRAFTYYLAQPRALTPPTHHAHPLFYTQSQA